MQFERYLSMYEQGLTLGMVEKSQSWKSFYEEMCTSLEGSLRLHEAVTQNYNHNLVEYRWYEFGKPYYKVWPTMVDLFTTTRLDIPVAAIKTPYEAFAIYLPSDPILTFGDGYWARSIMVSYSQNSTTRAGELIEIPCLTIWIDVGERGPEGATIFTHKHANFADPTIEQCFDSPNRTDAEGVAVPDSIIDACVRLAVAVCFVASGGERLVERDILSRHLDAYHAEAPGSERRKAWEKKSVKYGLGGWHIGRNRSERGLSLNRGMNYEEAVRDGQGGRSLLYSHWKGAHFQTFWKGPKRAIPEVKWVESYQVRKDLVPQPIRR